MTPPEQFLESYWQTEREESAETYATLEAARAPFLDEGLLARRKRTHQQNLPRGVVVFEDVQFSDGAATVIVRRPLARDFMVRQRYNLVAVSGSWKIARIDHECLFCRHPSQLEGGVCPKCQGEGWYDPDAAGN